MDDKWGVVKKFVLLLLNDCGSECGYDRGGYEEDCGCGGRVSDWDMFLCVDEVDNWGLMKKFMFVFVLMGGDGYSE